MKTESFEPTIEVLPPQINGHAETAPPAADPMLLSETEQQGIRVLAGNITNLKVALYDLEQRRQQLQQEMDLAHRALGGALFGYGRSRGIDREIGVSADFKRLTFKE